MLRAMVPTPAEVARRRWTLVIIIRSLAALVGICAVFPLGAWISLGAYDGNLLRLDYYAENFVLAIILPVAALGIVKIAPWAARRLVPIRPYSVCPGCNYRLEGLTEPRCPECGLILSAEFLGLPSAVATVEASQDGDFVFMRRGREVVVIILRLLGLLMLLLTFWSILVTIAFFGVATYEGWDQEVLSVFTGFGLWTLGCIAFNAALLFKARRLARWIAQDLGEL